jgi:hypothetical protein
LIRIHFLISSLISSIFAVAMAPAAHADETVTYEVASSDIAATNIEYFDLTGRKALEQVPLPWRINATVIDPHSDATEVRADWGPAAANYKWVTVRIYFQGSLLCEKTLDVGKEACYGGKSYKYGNL